MARTARLAARLGMSRIAGGMHPTFGPALRHSDPVAHADLVTSMCDMRAALCIARGIPLDDLDRDGYDLTKPESRAYLTEKRRAYGAKS